MRHPNNLLGAALLFVFVLFGQASRSQDASSPVILKVLREDAAATPFTMADLSSFRQIVLAEKDHDGKEHNFSGIAVSDLLKKAGVTMGDGLRGPNIAQYLIAKSKDGYKVVFALAELDSTFAERTVLLAFASDGKSLPTDKGPLQIIVPGEKKHARWIWGVDSLLVKHARD